MCTAQYDPICGTDGKTYGNPCELTSLSCMRKNNVVKLHHGQCSPAKVEKFLGCQMMCNRNYAPVCGTDGVTYSNQCEINAQACLTKSGVTTAFEGECSECQLNCNLNYDPVCGTNGVTYGNMCELTSTACLRKSGVRAAYSGECGAPQAAVESSECQLACQMSWVPVCGSDGRTYGNMCELTSTACLRKSEVFKVYDGECSEHCQMMCNMNYNPVCGSNGVTYGNECELTSLSCLRRMPVRLAHQGEC